MISGPDTRYASSWRATERGIGARRTESASWAQARPDTAGGPARLAQFLDDGVSRPYERLQVVRMRTTGRETQVVT
jgi:hypothetical protein